MNYLSRIAILLSFLMFGAGMLSAQIFTQNDVAEDTTTVVFRFVSGDDMFYIPWNGNQPALDDLAGFVNEHAGVILSGEVKIEVDGYAPTKRLAFVRANRVKSELILRCGVGESNFATTNNVGKFEGESNVVVVTIRLPKPEPVVVVEPVIEEVVEAVEIMETPEPVVIPEPIVVEEPVVSYSRWSIGANAGLPFFWGDMASNSADKTYIGFMIGVQGTYQISPMFGVTLSFDWAQNNAGSRDYAKGYLLDPSGMTWYTPQSFTTQAYGDLYSKINIYSAGLHLDVNVNRLFGPKIANSRLKLIVSPATYAQHFSSKVYTKSDDKVYVGDRLSKDLSLGLGGDVALRYNVSPTIDLQLKGTGIWITDNLFDNIRTVGYVKQNAMWGVSAGVVWKIGGNRDINLLHKKK